MRFDSADEAQGIGCVGRLARGLEVGLLADQVSEPLAHQRLIVHDEDPVFPAVCIRRHF
jgi:hypothetical protein